MSEIKTNKLTGTSTAGSILVTGEGNSTTTNLQQGLAKCWATHPHDDIVDDSFNLSSLGDVATGSYICNFANNMASTKYIVPSTGGAYAGGSRGGDYCGVNIGTGSAEARSTDHCDIFSMVGANASSNALATDRDGTMHIFFGDLAQ